MAFRLIPREEKFYTDFQALAVELHGGALLLEAMVATDRPDWGKADEIKDVEHKCDSITHEIIQRLNRTFVTPLDREDIHALARTLDDVMDAIDAAASLIRLYRLETVRYGVRELAQIVTASTSEIRPALDALRATAQRVRILFLDAATDVLVRRYENTRRRHPIGGASLEESIDYEWPNQAQARRATRYRSAMLP